MSMNDQKVLIVQDDFWKFCTASIKQVLQGSWLQTGGKMKLLVIIQAFKNSMGCGALLSCDRKLHSSATINKKKEDREEEIQEKMAEYSKDAAISEILKLAEMQQVIENFHNGFLAESEKMTIALHDFLNQITFEHVKSSTCGILKDVDEYFCSISRAKLWARPILREKKYMELIDPAVQDSVDLYQLFWMVRVAEQCLEWDPKLRMSMHEVLMAMACIINR